jgi:hypothetical protein
LRFLPVGIGLATGEASAGYSSSICSFFPDRTPDQGVLMKRFALLFVALVLSIQVAGCGSDTGSSPPAVAPGGGGATDSQPGEAKAFQEKEAARSAERAAAISRGKTAKPASK